MNPNCLRAVQFSMNARIVSLLAFSLIMGLTLADEASSYQPKTGEALAKRVREAMPPSDIEGRAILRTRERSGDWTEYDLRMSTRLVAIDRWRVNYVAKSREGEERVLVIEHGRDRLPRYERRQGKSEQKVLSRGDAASTKGYAGSEFSPLDLGLDFLHWPKQELVNHRITMRRSRPCFVIESSDPDYHGAPYTRVLSWIDREHLVIMRSEAYDISGKLLKTFEPDDVTKVNGEWRVKTVEIRNRSTKRKSELEFLYD